MGQGASKKQDKIEIMYLKHATTVENAVKILKSGYIYTELDAALLKLNLEGGFTSRDADVELEKYNVEGQYPGVYMSLISSNMVGSQIKNEISLYFCRTLLNRKDWHFNKLDSNGFLNPDNTILSMQNLKKFIQDGGELDESELVFHHSVPINFIVKINCRDTEIARRFYDKLPENLKKTFNPLIQLGDVIFPQYLECSDKIIELTPNYCFVFDQYERRNYTSGFYETIEYYKWMAMQCGLERSEVENVNDPDELNNLLKPLMYTKFRKITEEGFSIIENEDGEKRYVKEYFNGKRFLRKMTKNILEVKIARILMKNPNPNIVKIYRMFENTEVEGHYMNIDMEVLAFNPGLDFSVYKPQMENAKQFMQKLGIAYMDWRGDNIGFSSDGTVKVTNFDLSALYDVKTNAFIETPKTEGYLQRNAEEAGMSSPIFIDNWIFNNMFNK